MKNLKKLLLVIMAVIISLTCVACGGGNKPSGGGSGEGDSGSKDITPQGEVIMKVGVMSDSQLNTLAGPNSTNYTAPQIFENALNYYKDLNVSALFFIGDMVDNAQTANYVLYNSIINKVFPDKDNRPEIIYNLGNHERYPADPKRPNIQDDLKFTDAQWEANIDQEQRVHKVVNGYSFITVPSMQYGGASDTTIDRVSLKFLKENIEQANATANGKPIFVGLHEPISGTVYGDGFNLQSANVDFMLKEYPNVILFTGHSHFPISDERSIFQNNYTAINTGSASYCCLGKYGLNNGKQAILNSYDRVLTNTNYATMTPKKNEYSGVDCSHQSLGLVVELYSNVTRVERVNFNTKKQIGGYWSIPTNTTKEDFRYTNERLKVVNNLPTWDENHVAEAKREGLKAVVTWEDAHWGDSPVENYVIEMFEFASDDPIESVSIVSDYFAGVGESKYKVTLPCLDKKHSFNIRITPYDCFNHKGEPLELVLN